MKLQVKIESVNAAVVDDPAGTAVNSLWDVAHRIEKGDLRGVIRDVNGNHIGTWSFTR